MFNKSVFKQCVRSNGKLWAVFTLIACVMLGFMMSSFDAAAFSSFSSVAEGTKFEGLASNLGSFLGTLETYYSMIAVLLAMVYTIIASSNLVVGEVDSGSMAYTLATPIRRISVVFTKAVYMIGSLAAMFAVLTVFGIGGAELTQHCVSDSAITADVKAAAEAMDRRPSYVREHLYMIQDDEYALKSGADARDMDVESYSLYLDEAMLRDSYKAAAKELTEDREEYYEDYEEEDDEEIDDDFIEITWEELQADPAMMLDNREALAAGAIPMGMSVTEYKAFIENRIEDDPKSEMDPETTDEESENAGTELFNLALSAAAKELNIDADELADNLIWMKADNAMQAQMDATGLSEAVLMDMINQSMVAQALSEDNNWIRQNISEEMPIYLTGVSMGATTVLMASGLELPENVKGIIADCGFTAPHEIWKHVVEDNLHLSYGIRDDVAERLCRKKTQLNAREYSTLDALKECKVPVLFIHGTEDKLVPVQMTYENYIVCAAPKRLLIVPGADHA